MTHAPLACQPRLRRPTQGPEIDMLRGAVAAGLGVAAASASAFWEPQLPTGFPDLVLVDPRDTKEEWPRTAVVGPRELQVLHHLSSSGPATVPDLARALYWPLRPMEQVVASLVNAGVVRERGSTIVARALDRIFMPKRIVAIEAKMTDWREGLLQAVANTWFASESYLLVPPTRSLGNIAIEAAERGIGLLVFDGSSTQIVLRSSRWAIPVSYGSWLFNEWLVGCALRGAHYERSSCPGCVS